MKKLSQIFVLFGLCFFIFACSDRFCSLNCSAPSQKEPIINQMIIDDFAKQEVILMPKGEYLRIILPADKFFQVGVPALKKDREKALDNIAALLKQYGQATVKVEGYTDNIADDTDNADLSLARARSVLVYLWSQGLDAEHLYAAGLGSANPVGDPNDVVANGANRRIEIIVHAHCTTCF